MLTLVIVALAALVIGAVCAGTITHALGVVKRDAQLEVERIRNDLNSVATYAHQRITEVEQKIAPPPSAPPSDPTPPPAVPAPAPAPESAPAAPVAEQPPSAPEQQQ